LHETPARRQFASKYRRRTIQHSTARGYLALSMTANVLCVTTVRADLTEESFAMMESRIGKAARTGAMVALMLALAGCTHTPMLGKWTIASRDKEAEASYLD
jgi:hypothetical protein